MSIKKIVRKILPKELRSNLKQQFHVQTKADNLKHSKKISETVTVFSDNVTVTFEHEKFSEYTRIAIRKRGGKHQQKVIVCKYSASKIVIAVDSFLSELQNIKSTIERFDFFADFGDGQWVRLQSIFSKESNQFTYQTVSDDKVESIKIYTTLDAYYALSFNKFDEGFVLYDLDDEQEVLKIKNYSGKSYDELKTTYSNLTLNQNSEKDFSIAINDLINSENQQIEALYFALLEAKTVYHLLGMTVTLSSNLMQNVVKVNLQSINIPIVEASKEKNKLVLKSLDALTGWNDSLSIVAKRYNEISPLSAEINGNTIVIDNKSEDLIQDFASTLYVCRNLANETQVLSKIVFKTLKKETDVLVFSVDGNEIDFLQKNNDLDCMFDDEDRSNLLLSNRSFVIKSMYVRYVARPVFKKIAFNVIENYQVQSDIFQSQDFIRNFVGFHVIYQLNDKYYTTYKKITDLIIREELENL